MPIVIPDDGTISRAERIGRVLYTYGGIFIIFIIVGVYFGWINSPLLSGVSKTHTLLIEHQTKQGTLVEEFTRDMRELREEIQINHQSIERLIRLFKLLDCGHITDPKLQERCLAQ